jgi:hypothetical protein
MLVVQAFVIPRLGWPPLRLIRVGIPLTAVAFVVIAVWTSLPVVVAAVALSGLGHSLAIPGYTAAPTMPVGPQEQGAVAGLVGSVNASMLFLGPLLATGLYRSGPGTPFLTGAGVLLLLGLFALLHPRLGRGDRASCGTGPAALP